MKRRIDIAKILFYVVIFATITGVPFFFGLYSGVKQNTVYQAAATIKENIDGALRLITEEFTTLTKTHPQHFLQPARHTGNGVTVNQVGEDDALIFMTGFFDNDNGLRLVKRDGTVLASWTVLFSEIFTDTSRFDDPPATDWNVDIHGALILPDGSVVFNLEYFGLVKLDRCGRIVWTLNEETHHSVEPAEGGGFWVAGRRTYLEGNSPFPPFNLPFRVDHVMKVSEDGKLLDEINVVEMFYQNGLEALLTSIGISIEPEYSRWELIHLNKVGELTSDIAADFPMFEAGDLMLSMRQYNLLAVVDPETRRIKWWKIGPWIRQHDPEFRPGGTIVVFNNNTYWAAYGEGAFTDNPSVSVLDMEQVSNIIEIDPVTEKHSVLYGGIEGQEMLSVIRGKLELTNNGGLLITEFNGGRIFETDPAGQIVWEYINRYSKDEVAEVTEARIYPAGYFNVSDWACE